MNNHVQALSSKLKDKYVVTLILVVAVLAFIAGSEYKAYQFRSAMQDAVQWFRDAFKAPVEMGNKWKIQKEDEDEKTKEVVVKNGESYTYPDGMKLSIDSSKFIGKTLDMWYTNKTATKSFFEVIIKWENTWKVPQFKSLYDAKLVLSDGTTFKNDERVQLSWKREWFWWCISCEMNPSDKSIEGVYFDINEVSMTGAKLVLDSISYDL